MIIKTVKVNRKVYITKVTKVSMLLYVYSIDK